MLVVAVESDAVADSANSDCDPQPTVATSVTTASNALRLIEDKPSFCVQLAGRCGDSTQISVQAGRFEISVLSAPAVTQFLQKLVLDGSDIESS